MAEMLSDIDKFKKLNVKPGKELNLLLKHEEKLVSFLKGIKNILEKIYIMPLSTGFTVRYHVWVI